MILLGKKIKYVCRENKKFVYVFKVHGRDELITISSREEINTFLPLKLYGDFTDKAKKKFNLLDYTFSAETQEDLFELLSKGIEGCNGKIAKKIIDTFGERAKDALLDPEKLKSLFFFGGDRKAEKISKSYRRRTEHNFAKINLLRYGFPEETIMKILDISEDEKQIENIISKNIYMFCNEPFLVSFRTVERIALKHKLNGLDSFERLRGHAVLILEEAALNGHLYVDETEFIEKLKVCVNKGFENPLYSEKIILEMIKKLFKEETPVKKVANAVYLTTAEREEKLFAAEIVLRLQGNAETNDALLNGLITEYEALEEIKFSDGQKEAICLAAKNNVMVLTGGPGTGKTTVLKGIISILGRLNNYDEEDIVLLAPTGKAAKRMSESTGMNASTIHSALCIGEDCKAGKPVEGKLVIIDETSMLDQKIAHTLITAIPRTSKVIFVGDINQLQPVGPGDVLNGMISSGVVPVVKLTEIYRQQDTSSIVVNAYAINNGDTHLVYDENFRFVDVQDDNDALNKIVEIYVESVNKYGAENVALLCPRRRDSVVSVQNINPILQKAINKNIDSATVGDTLFIVGDRVMQNKNAAVPNGEIGIITAIYKELSDDKTKYRFKIDFSGHVVEYGENEMRNVELAYATTVHKSQGSEYDHVIIPILSSQFNMLKKNLVYTAVTRAKNSVCLVGQRKALYQGITNDNVTSRRTLLAGRLLKYKNKLDKKIAEE